MKRTIAVTLVVCLGSFFTIGCSEKSTMKDETQIKTPGGTTTITTEKEVKKTGDHKTGTTSSGTTTP